MSLRLFLTCVLALALGACAGLNKKKKAEMENKAKEPKAANATNDVSFQAFLGRLRKAAMARDTQTLASMMSPDFGYQLDPPRQGEGVFQHWEEKGLWPELQAILNERFVPKGDYMVAPVQFAVDPDYHGYRAGIQMVNGNWRFTYFVTD